MPEIGDLLKGIRGKDSLREASKKTGLSHNYISILERGIDPRTGSPIKPSPDTLRAYENGYNYPYEDLMKAAGYIETTKNDDLSIEEMEKKVADIEAILSSREWELNGKPVPKKLIDDILAYVRIQTTKDK